MTELPSHDMATITETREVCDVCRNPRRKVRTYRISYDGVSVRVTLCLSEHAKPIEQALRVGSPVSSPSPKVKVTTIEEIEKIKKERAKLKK